MSKNAKDNGHQRDTKDIHVDYDNIDAADIMEQIRKKIASQPKMRLEEPPPVDHAHQAPAANAGSAPYEGDAIPGARSRARRLLLKIMRPLSPLIKFMVLPVHEELRETIVMLDQTNRRLDYLNRLKENEFIRLNQAIYRIESRLDEELVKTIEYTKQLHGLSHNIVVELSKLKIEEEHLKNTVRILEKDFNFLGKRERAIEKEVFK